MKKVVKEMNLVRDGIQPPTFPLLRAAPDTLADPPPFMKNKTTLHSASFTLLTALALAAAGCGTSAHLAGLGVSVNVAQKGIAAGLTLNAGTNAITVGGSYSQGTNSISGSTTIPTGN
jgi:hypothetical protein